MEIWNFNNKYFLQVIMIWQIMKLTRWKNVDILNTCKMTAREVSNN